MAAGYCLYSSATHLAFTIGAGVNIFTLDLGLGEFVLTHPHVRMPPRGRIYSMNAANYKKWDAPMQRSERGQGAGGGRGWLCWSGGQRVG